MQTKFINTLPQWKAENVALDSLIDKHMKLSELVIIFNNLLNFVNYL